jgi:hypothetical protein
MPTPTTTQLIGGNFQDSEGALLALGYLTLELSQDETISGVGNICSGLTIKILLNSSGSVSTSPAQYVWGNDFMVPNNSYYKVTGYSAAGQPCWGPNVQQVVSGSTFDVGTWIPNQVISWIAPNLPVTFKNNGTLNSSQQVLNLESTDASVVITDLGSGNVNLQAVAAPAPIGPRPSIADWHYWSAANGSNSGVGVGSGVGISIATDPYSTGAGGKGVAATATVPTYYELQNPGGNGQGSSGGMYERSTNGFTLFGPIILSTLTDWEVKVVLNSSYNQAQTWIGMMDQSSFNPPTTISPTGYNIVGFRYAPTLGQDQFWQVFLGGQVTPAVINTAVPVQTDGLAHTFSIKQTTAGTLLFSIDGVQVAPSTYVGLTTNFYSFVWADNDNASTQAWASATHYGLGAIVVVNVDYYWQAENSGISGVTNPLPSISSLGDTINDNGITWVSRGPTNNYPPTQIGMAWLYWECSI